MFKPTPCLQGTIRRLPLSPKQAGKEYYKGNRVGSMGTIDKYGRFHPDFNKIRTFVYPTKGVKGFELTPFVSSRTPKYMEEPMEWRVPEKTITGEEYLKAWKEQGGHDIVDVPQNASTSAVWEEPVKKS